MTMTLARSRAIERAECATSKAFYSAAPPELSGRLGIATSAVAGATCLAVAKSQHGYLNRVVGLGLTRPATASDLDRIAAFYADRGVAKFHVDLSPVARPLDLGARLEKRGLTRGPGAGKLWRGDAPVTRTSTEYPVRRVGPRRADDWTAVFASVFRHFRSRADWFAARVGRPGWTHYAALDDDRMVAVGALYVADGVGHLVDGATLTPYRRMGLQRRIIETRVRAGLHAGARLFTSETAPPLPKTPLVSYRNLRRVGFRLAYIRPSYRLELS